MSEPRDPYEVLGVPRRATTAEIRAAYVSRARAAHPDLVGGARLDVMRALNEAWATLKDPGRRAEYDAAAAGRRPDAGPGAPGAEPGASGSETIRGMPFWWGAMGPPPGRPSGPVLDHGIFYGWSIGEIARRDRGYLAWLRDRPEGRAIRAEIDGVLAPAGEDEPTGRGRKR